MIRTICSVVCLHLLSLSATYPVMADTLPKVIGEAGITDGDTIRMPNATLVSSGETKTITNVKIRFHGIDAPEKKQLCYTAAGEAWSCGQDSMKALAGILMDQQITCEVHDVDRYDRLVAVCSIPGVADINAEMVTRGLAVAYQKYSMDYIDEEEFARSNKAGIWQGEFDMPWDWRKNH